MDLLETQAAAVVVPFASERETEQALRAERLAAHGIIEVLHERDLSPERLAQSIDRAISRPPSAIAIDTGGARRTALLIAQMVGSGERSRARSGENFV